MWDLQVTTEPTSSSKILQGEVDQLFKIDSIFCKNEHYYKYEN